LAISYTSDFKHTDWIDNVTRVKAGGEDGFNDHFHRIEDEFKKLSGVVTEIKGAMDLLGQKPPAKPITVTLTPVLATTGPAGWEHVAGSARKPTGAGSAAGTMSVDLPDGVTVQTLRVIGENGGAGVLVVQLRRQKLEAAAASEPVIGVTGSGGVFDSKNVPQDPTRALVDTDLFRYFITASVNGAAGTDVVRLDGFQITHIVQP
jgi:hypothetical protein